MLKSQWTDDSYFDISVIGIGEETVVLVSVLGYRMTRGLCRGTLCYRGVGLLVPINNPASTEV